MEERIYFKGEDVTVTESRFISRSKTYAMRNISSVQIGIIKPSRIIPIILILIGTFIVFSAENMTLGAITIAISILWLLLLKDKYTVRISSNSGEADGYISTNKESVSSIVKAINDAIIGMK